LAEALGQDGHADQQVMDRLATFAIAVTDGLLLQYYADPRRMPTSAELAAGARAALGSAMGAV
jgi:hypothetical protein